MSQAARVARRSARVMLQMYKEWDPKIQAHAKKMGATCKPGCNACCNLPASMSLPEGIAIAEYLMNLPGWTQRRAALERACRYQVNLMASLELWHEENRKAFFSRSLACVFLRDGMCSIYPVRPSVCRVHYAVTPPENCKLGAADPVVATIDFRELDFQMGLAAASELGEIVGGPIPVTMAIAFWRLGVSFDVDREAVRKATWTDAKVTVEGFQRKGGFL